jgi:Ni/Co efflux regulator RcnB
MKKILALMIASAFTMVTFAQAPAEEQKKETKKKGKKGGKKKAEEAPKQ